MLTTSFVSGAALSGTGFWEKLHKKMWEELCARMVVACAGFSKTSEACEKKWDTVLRQYQHDKLSGGGRQSICKFFDEIDEGFHNSAYVNKYTHSDAQNTPNPYPPVRSPTAAQRKKANAELCISSMTEIATETERIVDAVREQNQVLRGEASSFNSLLKRLIDKL